jgi:hypothetical protein
VRYRSDVIVTVELGVELPKNLQKIFVTVNMPKLAF